jgi:alkylated DNA repair dioxygenase AlkB
MDLFSSEKIINILPFDGVTNYHGLVLNRKQCDFYYQELMQNIQWINDQAIIFGKLIVTKRKVAWYGVSQFSYKYSGVTKTAHLFTKALLELKQIVEKETGETYNSCLLNLYNSGEEGMAYHSDEEKMLKKNGAIASLSLGSERNFSFKHKESKQRIDIVLENGSLLVMKQGTQTHWLHRLPLTKKVNLPRINLTFRTIELSS